MRIVLPTLDEQKRIACILGQAQHEIDANETQLAAYKEQKRGLMQKLLTGKVRVKV